MLFTANKLRDNCSLPTHMYCVVRIAYVVFRSPLGIASKCLPAYKATRQAPLSHSERSRGIYFKIVIPAKAGIQMPSFTSEVIFAQIGKRALGIGAQFAYSAH